MKLLLFISHNGGVSRRKAFDQILAGDVTINGVIIREPSHMMDPDEDKVLLSGREIRSKAYEYILLNKPAGYVTTCEAQFDQAAVMSLLPPNLRHLKPVGRLDKDTEGLLLLTNDGEMANRLAHPSFDVNKTYHVRVVRRIQFREKTRLEEGVVIEGFKTAPAEVANIQADGEFSEFDLTIHEGRKHQVRLMCHEVGHDVVRLTRVAQGPLKLDALKTGSWRPLTGEEEALLHAIGRSRIAPVFKSHAPQRRFSANRDWHSGQPAKPRETRTRDERGEYINLDARKEISDRAARESAPRREYKPYVRDDKPRSESAPRREYKPSSRDDRPRTDSAPRREYKPYSRDDKPRSESAPRREYKPYNRDDKPRSEGAPRREYKPYSRESRPQGDRPRTDRPSTGPRRDDRPRTDSAPRREYKPYSRDEKPRSEGAPRREYKPYSRDGRPPGDRPRTDRPWTGPRRDDRAGRDRPAGERREGTSSYAKPAASGARPYKKPFGKKPFGAKPFAKKPFSRPKH